MGCVQITWFQVSEPPRNAPDSSPSKPRNSSRLKLIQRGWYKTRVGKRPFSAKHSRAPSSKDGRNPGASLIASLALAAALESRRSAEDRVDTVRHVGVWPERGAVGDAAWRDETTGQLVTRDVQIPLGVLAETAQSLLIECGQVIRRLVGGLLMADWPEGTRRAVSFSFTPMPAYASNAANSEAVLAVLREAEGLTYDVDFEEN